MMSELEQLKKDGKLDKERLKQLSAEGNMSEEEMKRLAKMNGIVLTNDDLKEIKERRKAGKAKRGVMRSKKEIEDKLKELKAKGTLTKEDLMDLFAEGDMSPDEMQ